MLYDGGALVCQQPRTRLSSHRVVAGAVLAVQVKRMRPLLAGCPLCMREVNMLRRRDEGQGKILFVDIDSPEYSPAENAGITFEQGMANIHGILPDGRVITNVEVGIIFCLLGTSMPACDCTKMIIWGFL